MSGFLQPAGACGRQEFGGETVVRQRQEPVGGWPPGREIPVPLPRVADGWIALFDGHSLFGWRAESDANWHVRDGCLCADSGQPGLLRTSSQFDDFELELEFAIAEDTDSGIFLRTSPRPRSPTGDSIEVNLAPDSHPFPTGSLTSRKRRTSPAVAAAAGEKKFRRLRMACDGNAVSVWIDDKLEVQFRDSLGAPSRGYIGLQFQSGPVRFRNVWLRPAKPKDVLDPENVTRWKQTGQATWEFLPDGVVRAVGGPGSLESWHHYQDFILQTECRIADGQNSGIFFRCIPNQNLNGYESQIDNGFAGVPERPSNAGTGAIFRRTTVRRIAASDNVWFAKTIVACGAQVGVWVNGYQVTDWSDQRADDQNPRRGRRLEGGSIMLQAHDGQTDVRFRNLKIGELSPRRR